MKIVKTMAVRCPKCGSAPGRPCTTALGFAYKSDPHIERYEALIEEMS